MALIIYNKENSRPQQVVYQGKRTINMDSKGTVYLSKTMSIELGILEGGRINFAHDEDTEEWYICHTTDNGLERQKVRKVLRRLHCTQNYAPGKSRKKNCPVHDSQNSYGSGWNCLLQDTALKSDF